MIVKWSSFTDGIRQGYFHCLLSLVHRYKNIKGGEKWKANEILLDLEAIIKDIDTFIEYGEDCQLFFTDWDKKKKPIKGRIARPDEVYGSREEQKRLLEMLEKGYKE